MNFQFLPQPQGPQGLLGWLGAYQNAQRNNLINSNIGIMNQYLPAMQQADIAVKQAQPNLMNAQAQEALDRGGLFGTQSQLISNEMPYLVTQEKNKGITDPMLSRAVQLSDIQSGDYVSPSVKQLFGLTGDMSTNNNGMTVNPTSGSQGINVPNAQNPNSYQPLPGAQQSSGNSTMQNWALTGTPYSYAQLMQLQAMKAGLAAQAKEQGKTGVDQYTNALNEANQNATLAKNTNDYLDQFINNYKNTDLKGPVLGNARPISTSAQLTDTASRNLAALIIKNLVGGKVTNYEMQFAQSLKPSRNMTPEAAQELTDFLQQKATRWGEQQDFLNAAKNQGVDVQTANSLWSKYNDQRPVYDIQNKKPNTQFQKTWSDFLNPEAVNAVRTGQNYVSIPSFSSKKDFLNWAATLSPGDQAALQAKLAGGG